MSQIIRLFPLLLFPVLAMWLSGGEPMSFEMDTHVYSTENGHSLKLDLRMPKTPLSGCPGIVFVHGGAFQAGKRDSKPVSDFLDTLAVSGVASASISYRLTMKGRGFGCDVESEKKKDAVAHAGEDLIQALNWIQEHPPTRQWDGGWVAAGSSAGAETVLWSAYIDAPNRWEGAISFSGALDAEAVASASLPPLFAIHGTCDRLVPAECDTHHFCPKGSPGAWLLIGGPAWADSLRMKGQFAWNWKYCKGGHSLCTAAMQDPKVQNMVLNWLTSGRYSNRDILTDSAGLELPQSLSSCPQPCN